VHGLNSDNYTSANLLRSAMESAIYGLRAGLDIFRSSGCEVLSVRITGGGAKSAVWRQMVADIFGLPVAVQKNDEGAALGAALQACWAHRKSLGDDIGIAELVDALLELDDARACEPRVANVASYAAHHQEYLSHVDALFPLYSGDAKI
jgi:xylulokinase